MGNNEMHKILVVDDNMFSIKLVRDAMTSLGHEVVEAHDGIEGIEKAKYEIPALIFMDIQMPKMDGITAMKEIKRVPALNNVSIIAYTAHAMKGDREELLREGFDEYLSKPASFTYLKETAQRHLPQTTTTSP